MYWVPLIDVSSFPAGNINLIWNGYISGSEVSSSININLSNAPPVNIVSGQTTTLQDNRCVLGQPKTFTTKLRDILYNPIDGAGARLVLYDAIQNVRVDTPSGSLQAPGTGLYTLTYTLQPGSFNPTLNRYLVWWEANVVGNGFSVVPNSQQFLQVYAPLAALYAGQQTYSSNDDIRAYIANINDLLSKSNREQGEIEVLLNMKRFGASVTIGQLLMSRPGAWINPDCLKMLEIHYVWRALVVDSQAFSKMAAKDSLLKEIDKEIYKYKSSVLNYNSTIRLI